MSTEDLLINENQVDQSGSTPIEEKESPNKEKGEDQNIQNDSTPVEDGENQNKDNEEIQSIESDTDLINATKDMIDIEKTKKFDTKSTEDNINLCSEDNSEQMDQSDEDIDMIDDYTPSPSQIGKRSNSKENEVSSDEEDLLDNNQDKIVISDDGESSRNNSLSEIDLIERKKRKRRMHHLLLDIDNGQAMKKRRRKKDYLEYEPPKLQGKTDIFCWRCHKPGPHLASCLHCTKVYHLKCAQIEGDPKPQWVCPECEQIRRAECDEEKSKPGYINPETLRNLLFFAIKRMLTLEGAEHFIQPVDVSAYEDYCDFVLVPMDLTLLKKRVRDGMYKSTESFLVDVKFLLHNSYIYNSALSELTLVARQLVKIAKQECEEMHNCSDCYRHANTIKDKWFIEPCAKPHLLVWARLKGYPYWPGKVMKVHGPEVDVRFFGDHNRSMVPLANIFLFSKRPPYRIPVRHTQSFEEGKEEVQEHIEKLINIYGNFEYAPAKVQYDPKMEYGQLKMMIPSYGRKKGENKTTSSVEVTEQKSIETRMPMTKIQVLTKNNGAPSDIKVGNNVKTIISVDKRTFAHQTTIIAGNNKNTMRNDSDKKSGLKISPKNAKSLQSPGQRLIFSPKHVKINNAAPDNSTYFSNGKGKFDLSENSVVMNLKKKLMLSPDGQHSDDDSFMQGSKSEKSVHFYPKLVLMKKQEQSSEKKFLSDQLLCPTISTSDDLSVKEFNSVLKSAYLKRVSDIKDFENKHSEGKSILIKQMYVKPNNLVHNKKDNGKEIDKNRSDVLQCNTGSKLVGCDLPMKQPVILLHKLDEKILNKNSIRVEEENVSDTNSSNKTNNFNSINSEITNFSFSSSDEYPDSSAIISSSEINGIKVDGEGKVKETSIDEIYDSGDSATVDRDESHPPPPNLIEIDNPESEIGLCSLLTPNEICAVRQKPIKAAQSSEEETQNENNECNKRRKQSSPSSKDQSQSIKIRVRKDLMRNDLLMDVSSDGGEERENPEPEDIVNSKNPTDLKEKLVKKDDLLKISIHDVFAAMEKGETKEEVLEIAKKELESLEKYYESQLIYVTNNCASRIEEIDQIFEAERTKIRVKTRLECQEEKKHLIDEIKRKQWCVFCLNVAKFHCCWNTSYCSEKCQLADWPVHSKTCTQYKMRANDIDLRLNPKHKAFLTRYRSNNKILVQDVIDGHKRLNAVVNKPKVANSLSSLNVKIGSQVQNAISPVGTQGQKEANSVGVHIQNAGQKATKDNIFIKLIPESVNNGQSQNPSTSKPVMVMKNVYPMNVIKRKVPIVASTGISSMDQIKGEQKTGQDQQKLTKPCRLIEKKRSDGTKFFWLDASPSSSGEEEGPINTTSNVQIVNNHKSGIKRTATWDPSTTLEAAEFAMIQTSAGFRTVPSSVGKKIHMKVCGDKIEVVSSKQKTSTSPRKILPKLIPKQKIITNTRNFKGVIKTLDEHEIENIMNKNHLSGFDSSVEQE
ncbi:protein kinase C-binding protein 1 isoform X2 [Cimex lectularius]|uniref:Protein kinase C-binding protein 1 n=1 Tax=Cimex lectularius TaxID=79782 RepID=A0A8I6RF30_CIMLE|nr:protein kinase C-binding protein 1 isoform X2 [Cimex lectularius]